MTAEANAGFFVGWQCTLMRDILNRIIPPSGDFPGAGDLVVAEYIDGVVGRSAELKRLFSEGLVQIQIASQAKYSREFSVLSDEQKDALLRYIESESAVFFQALVRYTYNGYYINPRIIRLVGLEVRPPQPHGYQVEPLDPSLLKKVKEMGRVYRPA